MCRNGKNRWLFYTTEVNRKKSQSSLKASAAGEQKCGTARDCGCSRF